MFSFVPSRGAAPLDLSDVHAPFVRLVLALAAPAAAVAYSTWLINREVGTLLVALSAAATAATAVGMVVTRWEHAVVVLAIPGIGVAVAAWLSRIEALEVFASIVVVFVGAAAVVFIENRAAVFVGLYTGFLIGVHVLWMGMTPMAFVQGALTTSAFLASSLGMRWIRDRSMDSASRFLNLFERAPVSLWEEDFSRVGTWLEELREHGVINLAGYLEANRDALTEGMSLIEVVRVNQAAAAFLEVDDPQDLTGPLRPETFPEDALPSIVAQFEAIWNGDDHCTTKVDGGFTVAGNPLDGLLHWAVPHRFGRPDLTRVIVSVVDVTEMNNTRRSLERSLESKDELIATVSHELRTPLTTVVGLSTELSESYDDFSREDAQELLGMVADQSMEVATIVEDLLVAARAESGSLKVSVEPLDLHLEARTTLRGLDAEEEIDCHTVGIIPTVFGDSGRVRQILRNLIVNARRYGARPIRVIIRDSDDGVRVEVRDRGSAIPDAERELIFERYYRARQTPGVTASVGLGLTVSRELARLMGGDLTYHHDGESVFTFQLPHPPAQDAAATA